MFKCTHGLAPHYLSNDVTMHVDIKNGYDTRSAENMDLCIPRCWSESIEEVFCIRAVHYGNIPPWVKESTSLSGFKHNYRLLNCFIRPDLRSFYKLVYTYPVYHFPMFVYSLVYSRVYSDPKIFPVSSWYCCFHIWFMFMVMYMWFFVFIFIIGNKAPWKNSLLNILPCINILEIKSEMKICSCNMIIIMICMLSEL